MSPPAGSGAELKRCRVAYATRARQYLWTVELPPTATIAEALWAARLQAAAEGIEAAEIPWDRAPVGIFGELRSRSDGCADGDRIELYRSLARDPRERRRERVQREQRERRMRRGRGA